MCVRVTLHVNSHNSPFFSVRPRVRPPDVLEKTCAYLEEWVMVCIMVYIRQEACTVPFIFYDFALIFSLSLFLSFYDRNATARALILVFRSIQGTSFNPWIYISLCGTVRE